MTTGTRHLPAARPGPGQPSSSRWFALAVLCVSLLMVSLDNTVLNVQFFRRWRFSAAVSSTGLVMFGLFGALFVLTQYLQFSLGFSALQAGIRVLPAAGAIAVMAPLSTVLVRVIGTRFTVAAGLLVCAIGMWPVATASTATTYAGVLPGMVLLGVAVGLAIPSATESPSSAAC